MTYQASFDSSSALPGAAVYTPVGAAPATSTTRVLHVINGDQYAGAERVQDLLALRLAEHGFEVGFTALKPGQFAEQRRCKNNPLVDLPMTSKFDLRPGQQAAELIRTGGYALVHTHSPRSLLVGRAAALLAKVPHVHHVHSPTIRDTSDHWTSQRNAAVEKLCLRGVARIITVSESLSYHVRLQGFGDEMVTVVPNGVPTLGPLPARPAPRDVWTLGTVALFRPRKGLETLIEAMAVLRRSGRPVRLRAVGGFESPTYEAHIRALVSRHQLEPLIEWTGFVRDVNAQLRTLDLFILPSLFGEGMPMVVLEAMASGVPVVATQVEGIPEAVRNGVDGVLARPGDANDLARAITRYVTGDVSWDALRSSAHARQATQFSDRSMATGVAEVYRQTLASGGRVAGVAPAVGRYLLKKLLGAGADEHA